MSTKGKNYYLAFVNFADLTIAFCMRMPFLKNGLKEMLQVNTRQRSQLKGLGVMPLTLQIQEQLYEDSKALM